MDCDSLTRKSLNKPISPSTVPACVLSLQHTSYAHTKGLVPTSPPSDMSAGVCTDIYVFTTKSNGIFFVLFCFHVSWLTILILLAYMTMVIAIFLNILIAQLSDTYCEAKKTAKLQYAIDTMIIVTRLEYSRLSRWVRTVTTGLSQNGGNRVGVLSRGKTSKLPFRRI